jgi:hypothetical protein
MENQMDGATLIKSDADKSEIIADVAANVGWQMDMDRKIKALKAFQARIEPILGY